MGSSSRKEIALGVSGDIGLDNDGFGGLGGAIGVPLGLDFLEPFIFAEGPFDEQMAAD